MNLCKTQCVSCISGFGRLDTESARNVLQVVFQCRLLAILCLSLTVCGSSKTLAFGRQHAGTVLKLQLLRC